MDEQTIRLIGVSAGMVIISESRIWTKEAIRRWHERHPEHRGSTAYALGKQWRKLWTVSNQFYQRLLRGLSVKRAASK